MLRKFLRFFLKHNIYEALTPAKIAKGAGRALSLKMRTSAFTGALHEQKHSGGSAKGLQGVECRERSDPRAFFNFLRGGCVEWRACRHKVTCSGGFAFTFSCRNTARALLFVRCVGTI